MSTIFLMCLSLICFLTHQSLYIEQFQQKYMSFDQFIAEFHKPYKNEGEHAEQYQRRKQIYEATVQHLRQNPCQTCGINGLSDLTNQQFALIKGLNSSPQKYITKGIPSKVNQEFNRVGLPYRLNWAERNVITSVKNQGNCGTCWSFATIAMCESSMILQGKADLNIDLSEQYLLDCTTKSSCSGGYLYYAAESAVEGVPYESDWPYQEKKTNRKCSSFDNKVIVVGGFEFYSKLQDDEIKQLLVNGPVAVAVSSSSWKNYVGGVHRCDKDEKIDHAVLLVGYDEKGWILKNQWGYWWGQDGYIRVGYGDADCNLGSQVITLHQQILISITLSILLFLCLMSL